MHHLCLLQFLFKKYLEYEKSIGDEEQIEAVKKKAMEYVENTISWCLVYLFLSPIRISGLWIIHAKLLEFIELARRLFMQDIAET